MAHWILDKMTVQDIITNLDLNYMKLKAAKLYFEAYGVKIKGNTKETFIKNLIQAAKQEDTL